MTDLEKKIYGMAEDLALDFGFELEDVGLLGSGRRRLLRVAIDKPGGVTVEDCEAFSRDLSAILDAEDPIAGPYTLEVSSPGLDRPLKKRRHYEKSVGKLIRVVTLEKLEGQGFFLGRLVGVHEKGVSISVKDRIIEIPFDNIKNARLEAEI